MEVWELPEGVNLRETFVPKHLKHTSYKLTQEQQKLLRKQGHKYLQLKDGTIQPQSPKQKHFVAMCDDPSVDPIDEWEAIWRSYSDTVQEDNRLEKIHRAGIIESSRADGHAERFWFGGGRVAGDNTSDLQATETPVAEDRPKKCQVCRASGMKGDGDNCDRCNGWGWT